MADMSTRADPAVSAEPIFGIGCYTVPEAARLIRMPARNINRWLGGYTFKVEGVDRRMPPLWRPELPANDDRLELGFRDLIELRFVQAFVAANVSLQVVRNCLEHARNVVADARPLSTRRFKTDGRTIFLEMLRESGEEVVMDLRQGQYVIKTLIDRTFKDLDLEGDVVSRWRPFEGRSSIVVDPQRAFGQPITSETGIPTATLADAVRAEGSVDRVARLFEVSPAVVRDAARFEDYLSAA